MYSVLSCLSTDKPVKRLHDAYEILLFAYNLQLVSTGAQCHLHGFRLKGEEPLLCNEDRKC